MPHTSYLNVVMTFASGLFLTKNCAFQHPSRTLLQTTSAQRLRHMNKCVIGCPISKSSIKGYLCQHKSINSDQVCSQTMPINLPSISQNQPQPCTSSLLLRMHHGCHKTTMLTFWVSTCTTRMGSFLDQFLVFQVAYILFYNCFAHYS